MLRNTLARKTRRAVLTLITIGCAFTPVVRLARAAAPGVARAADAVGRQRLLIDSDWRFHPGDLSAPTEPVQGWRWKADNRGEAFAAGYIGPDVDTTGPDWKDLGTPTVDVSDGKPGYRWFRVVLDASEAAPPALLHFDGEKDNARVWVNGVYLYFQEGRDEPFDVPLTNVWRSQGKNVIAVLIRNTNAQGYLGRVTLSSSYVTTGAGAERCADADWQRVHLPHDFLVNGKPDRAEKGDNAYMPAYIGWYRRTLAIPRTDAGRRIFLDFDGVYRDSSVYLNGHVLGTHSSGYTGFEYDATQYIHFGGNNEIAVRVDPRHFEGWWYEGGGIYRHVYLVKTAPLHVAHWGTFVRADVPGPDKAHPTAADLTVETTLKNSGGAAETGRLISRIVDPQGRTLATGTAPCTASAANPFVATQHFHIAAPALWSLEKPQMYRLITEVVQKGGTTDDVTTDFGIRTIAFDPSLGFFLNGKHVEIKGTCNHQNFAVVGTALPDNLQWWRIQALKTLGSSAYRTAHDPQAPETLDACDRLGILVMDENRHLGDTYQPKSGPGTPYADLSDLRDLILRDRNHPSVFIWSMCNEEWKVSGAAVGARIFKAMRDLSHSLDPTRPVSSATLTPWNAVGVSSVEDLQGCNHGLDDLDDFHKNFPQQPMFGSEFQGALSDRGVYVGDPKARQFDNYSLSRTAERGWKPAVLRPFMAGTFIWTAFDYQGEAAWPSTSNHFGFFDMSGFPKDGYYYYAAWWRDTPVLHIFPHWNWPGKEGQPVVVWCYANSGQVELLLNGVSLGIRDVPKYGHVAYDVPYAPGRLEARAITNGRQVADDVVETTGAAARLELMARSLPFRSNGEDAALIEVAVRDAQGRLVPTANNDLRFTVQGPATIWGTNSGDPNDHILPDSPERLAFNGRCLLVLRASHTPGSVVVTVASPGLPPATITLQEK